MNLNELVSDYSYFIAVTLFFSISYLFFNFKINKSERTKLKSVEKREFSEAIETDSPVKDQGEILKQKGIDSIEDRFSFMRKIFPLFWVVSWFIIICVPYLGKVPSVYISILAAILSVMVGVSIRPFLENLFSGIVISFFRSVKVGDTVIIDSHYGLIEEIGLTYSVLKRWDWNRIVVPNAKLLEKEVQNLTLNDQYIWAHVEFFISPEVPVRKVEEIAIDVAKKSPYFNGSEDPSFWIMELQKDTVKCWLAAWADSPSDAWELRSDMRTNLLKAFQTEGIEFHKINIIR